MRAHIAVDNGEAAAGELLALAADPAAASQMCLGAMKVRRNFLCLAFSCILQGRMYTFSVSF